MTSSKKISITFNGRQINCRDGETVLEALERSGEQVESSCRAGTCQSCRLKCSNIQLPERAQRDLSSAQKSAHLFLSCVCPPVEGMEVQAADALSFVEGAIKQIEQISEEIVRLTVQCSEEFSYQSGQFVSLQRDDGLTRQYSLASKSNAEELEFHIRLLEGGQMSAWLKDGSAVGSVLKVSEAVGGCVYYPEFKEKNLVLIGTGTGLAPLYGVLGEALASDHQGVISLFHGSAHKKGLYLVDALADLAKRHENFHYYPCVSREPSSPGFLSGRANEKAKEVIADWENTVVYLCGNPEMVKQVKMEAYLAGVPLRLIFADPFTAAVPAPETKGESLSS